MFNKFIEMGWVPIDWKTANVSALYKHKGSKSDAANYRPISLTSHIGKIFERILKEAIVVHLENSKSIKNSQHGFRKNRSCLTNLLEFLDEVSEYIDKGVPIDVIYLDFQKAFDKVPHERLMVKVKDLGITRKVWDWIHNWLLGRKQRVVLVGFHSNWTDVKSGVPQGSVLGPVLFLIFINDIDVEIQNSLLKVADDTKIFGNVGTTEDIERLKRSLHSLFTWSVDWQMLFNLEKCKVIHMETGNVNTEYFMDGVKIQAVEDEKDLGVIINKDLKVSKQCIKAAKMGNKILGMINRSFEDKSKSTILRLYKSLVRPHLDYCSQAWNPYLIKDIKMLERVQRRATKMIKECKGMSYEDRLKKTGLTTLETRRIRADLIEVYKIVNSIDKIDRELFQWKVGKTRGNSLKMFKKRFRINIGKYGFSNRVIDNWNKLNNDIVTAKSLNLFKGKLDSHLRIVAGLI